eukprot:gene15754-11279_t
MPHQLEGLQWLLSLWENGLNGILADEMGLGKYRKTIQIISLIAHLREHNTAGPYLIAGPLATLGNWIKEFHKWLPTCPVVLYHGTKDERAEIRRKKMPINQQKTLDFPIVITSFELCIADRNFLEKYVWQYIILDEGHRIKNRNCRLIRDLKTFQSTSRLLLTGTPIQNSLEELWSLLNFCSPMIFDDLDVFKSWFGFRNIGSETRIEDILDEEQRDHIVTKLHDILRPFVLRRMKKDTLKDLVVQKKEVVVYCAMSSLQREFYQCVLDGNLRELLIEMGIPRAKNISQINTMMNLRKICNHPYLFGDITQAFQENGDNAQRTAAQAKRMERLFITASGKFRLLDRMLPRLLDEGHKVILFSQMTEVLNLIEDYLAYREINWVRLDGATTLDERQEAIDRFNAPDSDVQIFLLSTRAGGLGTNFHQNDLTTERQQLSTAAWRTFKVRLRRTMALQHAHEGFVAGILSSVGLAACAIQGSTLHQLFGISAVSEDSSEAAWGQLLNKTIERRVVAQRLRAAQVIIIDEVSMLGPRLFEFMDQVLRRIRGSDSVMGDVQIVCCGDVFQLPPVQPTTLSHNAPTTQRNREMLIAQGQRGSFSEVALSQAAGGTQRPLRAQVATASDRRRYCSQSALWSRVFPPETNAFVLSTVYRQQTDPLFAAILEDIRLTAEQLQELNDCCHGRLLPPLHGIQATQILTHKGSKTCRAVTYTPVSFFQNFFLLDGHRIGWSTLFDLVQ